MSDPATITARIIGNPWGGTLDNPWSPGHPVAGERAAIFAFDVVDVDSQATRMRSFHIAPVERATEGPVDAAHTVPQGVTVQWTGCGAGTVVGTSRDPHGEITCDVRPDTTPADA